MADNSKIKIIAVEGLIKSDNTRLTKALAKLMAARPILEETHQAPLISFPSSDPQDFTFKKHLLRLIDRHRAQKQLWQTEIFHDIVISDYLFYADRIYARLSLPPEDMPLYELIIDFMEKEVAIPDLVIYLQRQPASVMEKLSVYYHARKPGLHAELLNENYVTSLCNEFNEFFLCYRWSPVLIVNANRFSPDNEQHALDLYHKIQKPFTGVLFYNPPVPEFIK